MTGLKLLGCLGRIRKGVRHGCLYTIKECEEEVALGELPTASTTRERFRQSHCQIYASCLGTEFGETCRLHELKHPRFTRKHLLVGISRCRSAELVSLA